MDKGRLYSSSSKEHNDHTYDPVKDRYKLGNTVSSQAPEKKKLATPSSPLHDQGTPAASSCDSENSILLHDINEDLEGYNNIIQIFTKYIESHKEYITEIHPIMLHYTKYTRDYKDLYSRLCEDLGKEKRNAPNIEHTEKLSMDDKARGEINMEAHDCNEKVKELQERFFYSLQQEADPLTGLSNAVEFIGKLKEINKKLKHELNQLDNVDLVREQSCQAESSTFDACSSYQEVHTPDKEHMTTETHSSDASCAKMARRLKSIKMFLRKNFAGRQDELNKGAVSNAFYHELNKLHEMGIISHVDSNLCPIPENSRSKKIIPKLKMAIDTLTAENKLLELKDKENQLNLNEYTGKKIETLLKFAKEINSMIYWKNGIFGNYKSEIMVNIAYRLTDNIRQLNITTETWHKNFNDHKKIIDENRKYISHENLEKHAKLLEDLKVCFLKSLPNLDQATKYNDKLARRNEKLKDKFEELAKRKASDGISPETVARIQDLNEEEELEKRKAFDALYETAYSKLSQLAKDSSILQIFYGASELHQVPERLRSKEIITRLNNAIEKFAFKMESIKKEYENSLVRLAKRYENERQKLLQSIQNSEEYKNEMKRRQDFDLYKEKYAIYHDQEMQRRNNYDDNIMYYIQSQLLKSQEGTNWRLEAKYKNDCKKTTVEFQKEIEQLQLAEGYRRARKDSELGTHKIKGKEIVTTQDTDNDRNQASTSGDQSH